MSKELNDFKNGYNFEGNIYKCLFCDKSFEQGVIYPYNDKFEDAHHGIIRHIEEVHGGTLNALLDSDKKDNGLSDIQSEIVRYFANGLSDKNIATRMNLSASTVRNHRFKLKEKKQQAIKFLAVMDLLDSNENRILPQNGVTELDEMFNITPEEKEKVIKIYFNDNCKFSELPKKEKKKVIILQEICKQLDPSKNYSEQSINNIISSFCDDYVTVRRYLIEYKLIKRTDDGNTYWVNN